jgi:hypothetical protein
MKYIIELLHEMGNIIRKLDVDSEYSEYWTNDGDYIPLVENPIDKIKKIAKNLIDDGTNVEYVRGICELIADIDGKEETPHADRAIEIAKELGLSEYAAKNLYKQTYEN